MDRKICEECGEKIISKKIEFTLYGEGLGLFPAEVCAQCGEEVFDEEVSDKIDAAAKQKGYWGLEADTKITKIGSSNGVLLNKKLLDFTGLKSGTEVHIYPESKRRIVIEVSGRV